MMNTIATTERDLAGRGAQADLNCFYAPVSIAYEKRRSGRLLNCIASAVLLGLLSACSGGSQPFNPVGEAGANSSAGGENNPVDPDNNNPAAVGFTVGGTISGVSGEKVVLLNNGKDELIVADDGKFEFKDKVSASGKYDVTIKTQPMGFSKCIVEGTPSGTVSANVADIKVVCKASGTVSLITLAGAALGNFSTLVFDTSGANLYAMDDGADILTELIKITLSANRTSATATPVVDFGITHRGISGPIFGLAVDKNDTLYLPEQGAPEQVFKGVVSASASTWSSEVKVFNSSDYVGVNQPRDVVLSNDQKTLYTLNSMGTTAKKVLKVDLSNISAGVLPVPIDPNITATQPNGIAIDTDGNLYIANTQEHNIIKVSAAGKSEVFAGSTNKTSGTVDGKGTAASFNLPMKIVFDSRTDMLYVTDSGNHRIRKISKTGVVGTVAGSSQSSTTIPTTVSIADAKFDTPIGITVDPSMTGTLYVTDKKSTIRKIEAK